MNDIEFYNSQLIYLKGICTKLVDLVKRAKCFFLALDSIENSTKYIEDCDSYFVILDFTNKLIKLASFIERDEVLNHLNPLIYDFPVYKEYLEKKISSIIASNWLTKKELFVFFIKIKGLCPFKEYLTKFFKDLNLISDIYEAVENKDYLKFENSLSGYRIDLQSFFEELIKEIIFTPSVMTNICFCDYLHLQLEIADFKQNSRLSDDAEIEKFRTKISDEKNKRLLINEFMATGSDSEVSIEIDNDEIYRSGLRYVEDTSFLTTVNVLNNILKSNDLFHNDEIQKRILELYALTDYDGTFEKYSFEKSMDEYLAVCLDIIYRENIVNQAEIFKEDIKFDTHSEEDVLCMQDSLYTRITAPLELDDLGTRYSKLRKLNCYKDVRKLFYNNDIYSNVVLWQNSKGLTLTYADIYKKIYWEEIFYIATTIKDRTGMIGFMHILYMSECFNWKNLIAVLLNEKYSDCDSSDKSSIDFAKETRLKLKELEDLFTRQNKPDWKHIKDYIQVIFEFMFKHNMDFGEIKNNSESYAIRDASIKFSKNNEMLGFADQFGYDLNSQELEKKKENEKKTNAKRKINRESKKKRVLFEKMEGKEGLCVEQEDIE